ncbi:uncharacterized protein KY384_009266 [Bacidia gigantensis]|uniref:uncharacterized protein n=1 Tax=Bacidia gigantensis TaxID=2732470 RepID=UPI001D04807C|nr:uncharacterized protein KY384_009266 [Bacidia gigantensis]KAG8525622.1 hypothetical protein KY384_009266 [Bacidia gigantensis]
MFLSKRRLSSQGLGQLYSQGLIRSRNGYKDSSETNEHKVNELSERNKKLEQEVDELRRVCIIQMADHQFLAERSGNVPDLEVYKPILKEIAHTTSQEKRITLLGHRAVESDWQTLGFKQKPLKLQHVLASGSLATARDGRREATTRWMPTD